MSGKEPEKISAGEFRKKQRPSCGCRTIPSSFPDVEDFPRRMVMIFHGSLSRIKKTLLLGLIVCFSAGVSLTYGVKPARAQSADCFDALGLPCTATPQPPQAPPTSTPRPRPTRTRTSTVTPTPSLTDTITATRTVLPTQKPPTNTPLPVITSTNGAAVGVLPGPDAGGNGSPFISPGLAGGLIGLLGLLLAGGLILGGWSLLKRNQPPGPPAMPGTVRCHPVLRPCLAPARCRPDLQPCPEPFRCHPGLLSNPAPS